MFKQPVFRQTLFRQTLQPPDFSGEEARDIADSVLAGRAYTEAARPPTLQERIFNWIGDLFSDLLNALSSTGGRGIVAWLIIAIFVAVIGYLVFRLIGGAGTLPVRQPSRKPTIAMIEDRTAAEWLAAADEAEQLGDWRRGIRCRHRSLVAELVDRELVTARPGFTAGDIERRVTASHPEAHEAVSEATNLFKDTWYGWAEATEASRDRFAELASQIMTATSEPTVVDERQPEPV